MWKIIAPILVALGVFERVIGLAGIPDDVKAWRKVLAMIPDEVFGGAIVICVYLAWKRWGTLLDLSRETVKGIATLTLLAIGAAAVAFVVFFVDVPSHQWVHPAMTQEEIDRARAECRMEAIEASGGRIGFANAYIKDCMVVRGLEKKWVREGR